MKILVFACLCILASCSTRNGETMVTTTESLADTTGISKAQDSTMAETPANSGATNATNHVQVVIQSIEGYGQYEPFARAAARKLEAVINSPAFHDQVLRTRYTQTTRYSQHNRLSPAQIYDLILAAHELSGPGGKNGVIDLRLRTISLASDGQYWMNKCEPGSHSGTLGLDGGTSGVAAICPQWLAQLAATQDTASLAAHFIHEYMHILHFEHRGSIVEAIRERTVPYRIQNIVYQLAKPKTQSGTDNTGAAAP